MPVKVSVCGQADGESDRPSFRVSYWVCEGNGCDDRRPDLIGRSLRGAALSANQPTTMLRPTGLLVV